MPKKLKIETKIFCDSNYEKSILLKLKKLQINEKFCDAIVISGVDAKRINVHRVVLLASSDFFATLFASSTSENENDEFIIDEIAGNVLECFVDFCYTGKIELKMEEIEDYLIAAEKLKFSKLFDAAVDYISEQINLQNFVEISLISERVKSKKLKENVFIFSKRLFLELSKNENFLKLATPKLLSQLVNSNDLNINSEEDIFNAIMSWINVDAKKRKKFIPELLGLLKMTRLSTEFIEKKVRPICNSNGCNRLYLDAIFSRASSNELRKMNKNLKKPQNTQTCKNLLAVGFKEFLGIQILKYSFETNNWSSLIEIMNFENVSSCCLWQQKLFLIKKSKIICFDIEKEQIEPFENFKKERFIGANVTFFQGCIFVLGGVPYLKSVEKWDPETEKWSDIADMKVSRHSFGTAVLNELLYVVGGFIFDSQETKSTECYNPQKNAWTNLAPMNETRIEHGVTTDGRFIYAVGGRISSFEYSRTIECYDPQINKWKFMMSLLHEPRCCFGCIFLNNKIFAVGGRNVFKLNTVETFQIKNKKLSYGKSLPIKYDKVFLFRNS